MKRFSLFILCFIFWLLLVMKLDWENVAAGLVIAFLVSLLFGGLEEEGKKINPVYFPVFFIKTVLLWKKAVFTQIYLSIFPGDFVNQEFEIKINTTDDKSRAFLIMALNLSPNIIVTSESARTLLVNSQGRTKESVEKEIKGLENLIGKMFTGGTGKINLK